MRGVGEPVEQAGPVGQAGQVAQVAQAGPVGPADLRVLAADEVRDVMEDLSQGIPAVSE